MSSKLKTNFKVQNRYGAFYTGGKVQYSKNGDYMFCQNGDQVQVLEVKTGQQFKTIGQEGEDEVTNFVLSPDDKMLVVAGKSLLLRQYDWMENTVTRTWKAIHMSPVSCMSFDVTSTLLATGGSDSTIKVWDVIKQYCTHNLKGHTGVISIAEFHPDIDKLLLFSAGNDYKVRVWDLKTSACVSVLEHHYSVITSIAITPDHSTLFCGSRDNTVSIWNLENKTKQKTIPVYEGVEGLVLMPPSEDYRHLSITSPDHVHFITAGAKGNLKVWDSVTAQCLYTLELTTRSSSDQTATDQAITSLLHNRTLGTISVVTYDHNIVMYKLQDFALYKQFVGYNDEILDLHFMGPDDSSLAVASNSELVKVFTVETWDCQILRGHTDTVMSLDVSTKKDYLTTASKDNSIRVWHQDKVSGTVTCMAVGHGHTNNVQAVAFSRLTTSFVVSGSQDLTLKLWLLPSDLATKQKQLTLRAEFTEKAHDKDINAIIVSPNDKLIATGSQDKTAKLWRREDLSLQGVFRGHKRGIWCIQFSPVDQCIATSSADGTVKIWALSDYSCVKTFEGHDCSVLKLTFISHGMQLLSTGSDGLLKLWTIKSSECVNTFDEHEDKAWALEVSQDGRRVVTGAGDSCILLWKDVTVEEQEEARAKQEEFILKEQELQNLLYGKKYLKALGLAISLDQPFRVLRVVKDILSEENGKQSLHKTISKLETYQIDTVLRYASTWNTNSKHCYATQSVLSVILKTYPPEELLKLPNFKSSLEGLLPYTERHCSRMRRLEQQTTFVDYTWQSMRPVTDNRPLQSKLQDYVPLKADITISGEEKASDSSEDEGLNVKEETMTKRQRVEKEASSCSDSSSEDEVGKTALKKKNMKSLTIKTGDIRSGNASESLESSHPGQFNGDNLPGVKLLTFADESVDKGRKEKLQKSGNVLKKKKQSQIESSSSTGTKHKKCDTEVNVKPQKGGQVRKVSQCISDTSQGKKSDSGCEDSYSSDLEMTGSQRTPPNKKVKKEIKVKPDFSVLDKDTNVEKENMKSSKKHKKSPSKKRQKVKDESSRKRTRSGSLESVDRSNSEGELRAMTLRKTKHSLKDLDTDKFEFDSDDDDVKTPYTTFKLTGRTPKSTGKIPHKVKLEDKRQGLTYTDPGTMSTKPKTTLQARKLKSTLK